MQLSEGEHRIYLYESEDCYSNLNVGAMPLVPNKMFNVNHFIAKLYKNPSNTPIEVSININ